MSNSNAALDNLDREILEKRRERLKEAHRNLESGIYLHGDIITFERRGFLDLFSLMLPTTFNEMSEELKHVKYTSKFSPIVTLTNEDLSVNLGFNMFTDHTSRSPITGMAGVIKETLESKQSTFDFQDITPLKDVDGCYFQFYQTTFDIDVFHVMAFVRINDQIVQATFNCLSDLDLVTWQTTVVQMLETIKKYEKEKGDY